MRTLLVAIIASSFGFFLFVPSLAQEVSRDVPAYMIDGTRPPELSAKAWGIFDTETGELLLGKDINAAYPIASVTKLMTAHVALNVFPVDTKTKVSQNAVLTEGKSGSLQKDEEYSIRDLFFPLILSSSNDAAVAIAEFGGDETFISEMNKTARSLGMMSTRYEDASGLSPMNVSSVADLSKLLSYVAQEEPYLLDISQLQKYVGKHTWHNVNKTSTIDTFRGGKHGYTEEANRTLVALFEEQLSSGNSRYISIVLLGSDNLQADVEILRTFLQQHLTYR